MLGIEFYGYAVALEKLDITVNYENVKNRYKIWDGDTELFDCNYSDVVYITYKALELFVDLGYTSKEEAFEKIGDYLYLKDLIDDFKNWN